MAAVIGYIQVACRICRHAGGVIEGGAYIISVYTGFCSIARPGEDVPDGIDTAHQVAGKIGYKNKSPRIIYCNACRAVKRSGYTGAVCIARRAAAGQGSDNAGG